MLEYLVQIPGPRRTIDPKRANLATDLLSNINKPISGCICMACDNLLATSLCCKLSTDLLQVDCQNLLPTGLLQVVSTSCNKSANDKLQQA